MTEQNHTNWSTISQSNRNSDCPWPLAPVPLWWITLSVRSPGEYTTSKNCIVGSSQCNSPDESYRRAFVPWDNWKTPCCSVPTTRPAPVLTCCSCRDRSEPENWFEPPAIVNTGSYDREHPFAPKLPQDICSDPEASILAQTSCIPPRPWYYPDFGMLRQSQGSLQIPARSWQSTWRVRR